MFGIFGKRRWMKRVARLSEGEVLRRLAVAEDNEILEAVLCVLAEMENDAVEGLRPAKLTPEERAWGAGLLAGAAEGQERIVRAVREGNRLQERKLAGLRSGGAKGRG